MSPDPYLANVTIFGGNFAPAGWMFCDGSLLPISQYDALYALLGTTYGGDGQTTFGLPDLRGRVAINAGQGPGLSSFTIGETGGSESITLTTAQIAIHNHPLVSISGAPPASAANGSVDIPTGIVPATINGAPSAYSNTPTVTLGAGIVSTLTPLSMGGNSPVGILSPVLAMNYIIAVEGIFPSRN